MKESLPPCPHLPPPREAMDWRAISAHGKTRGEEFYLTALEYGHYLWRRRFAARAILCLDRAFGADLSGEEPVLETWPLPYAAMSWVLRSTPADLFVGNPRVHFQHYAGRMNYPRREQRRWRAWACWGLTRAALPDLPGDSKHLVEEPSVEQIAVKLDEHGHHGESVLWRKEWENAGRSRGRGAVDPATQKPVSEETGF